MTIVSVFCLPLNLLRSNKNINHLQLHINFILSVNLKVTMKFPYEVHLSSTHSIIPRHREVERYAKMLRIGQSA
jgi:hypothetical protein